MAKRRELTIGIIGSTNWSDIKSLRTLPVGLKGTKVYIADTAKGAGRLVKGYCKGIGVDFKEINPDLDRFDPEMAYEIVHDEIIKKVDVLCIFQKGNSRLQNKIIQRCQDNDIPFLLFRQ